MTVPLAVALTENKLTLYRESTVRGVSVIVVGFDDIQSSRLIKFSLTYLVGESNELFIDILNKL